jgi:PLP dependent protein
MSGVDFFLGIEKKIYENIEAVKCRIGFAVMKSGRCACEVKLLPVTKECGVREIGVLIELGYCEFGESRVQELEKKAKVFPNVKWHFIGHLQSNKVKSAVSVCEVIHSVDSLKIAEKINRCAHEKGKVQKVFVEVNVSGERTKNGVEPEELRLVLQEVKKMQNVEVFGLMCMAPFVEPEKTRVVFRKLKLLCREHGLNEMSAGMSNDFEVAVEEGSTCVRVGSVIFG